MSSGMRVSDLRRRAMLHPKATVPAMNSSVIFMRASSTSGASFTCHPQHHHLLQQMRPAQAPK